MLLLLTERRAHSAQKRVQAKPLESKSLESKPLERPTFEVFKGGYAHWGLACTRARSQRGERVSPALERTNAPSRLISELLGDHQAPRAAVQNADADPAELWAQDVGAVSG
ncbi:hypothetical protein Deipe_2570 [Deinococcus peraridilitoris DSM 19664]|uniref:Uncharacterized protein n=1 Tax=Deinococcus peraridilitoris (strain DSM 19664 / LMG 22246 / CIP 109416 / KR-200) TaxID=937777 RepID=L0A4U4_DEIPD|nr:hypothetical protein Deipe_2570 [Deinococcus peraridilitoris DSM 19664]